MGVRILEDRETGQAALFCSTADWAFGPLFQNRDRAESFLAWLDSIDPRRLNDAELEAKHAEWHALEVCDCGHERKDHDAEPEPTCHVCRCFRYYEVSE